VTHHARRAAKPTPDRIYTAIDRQFRDTWQMTYDTAVRPGRRLRLAV